MISSNTQYAILATAQFNKDIRSLDHKTQVRLARKLKEIEMHPDPLSLAKPLTHFDNGQNRWSLGAYRVTFDVHDQKIYLLNVRHRREVYR